MKFWPLTSYNDFPTDQTFSQVLWSIWGSHQTLWSLPLPNITWHSGTWPYTMTPSIDQTLHPFANLLPNWTLLPILTLLPNFGGFHRTMQRVRLANRGRLLLRTPGPVPFGTCICSNVETILSWTCHVYGPFEFRTSLGTSILLHDPDTEVTFTELRELSNGICDGCDMPVGSADPSGHLVPSLLPLAYARIVETSCPELPVSFLDFSSWISLDTFSILLIANLSTYVLLIAKLFVFHSFTV